VRVGVRVFVVSFACMASFVYVCSGICLSAHANARTHTRTHPHPGMLKDEEVTGTIRIRPTKTNKRHLDIRLNYEFNGQVPIIFPLSCDVLFLGFLPCPAPPQPPSPHAHSLSGIRRY
jgi:hypothetical protein